MNTRGLVYSVPYLIGTSTLSIILPCICCFRFAFGEQLKLCTYLYNGSLAESATRTLTNWCDIAIVVYIEYLVTSSIWTQYVAGSD